jgi:hypothetical protein
MEKESDTVYGFGPETTHRSAILLLTSKDPDVKKRVIVNVVAVFPLLRLRCLYFFAVERPAQKVHTYKETIKL